MWQTPPSICTLQQSVTGWTSINYSCPHNWACLHHEDTFPSHRGCLCVSLSSRSVVLSSVRSLCRHHGAAHTALGHLHTHGIFEWIIAHHAGIPDKCSLLTPTAQRPALFTASKNHAPTAPQQAPSFPQLGWVATGRMRGSGWQLYLAQTQTSAAQRSRCT